MSIAKRAQSVLCLVHQSSAVVSTVGQRHTTPYGPWGM